MDYKQKYETALENLKKIKAANKDNNELVNFIEFNYPELKESEGERIRKQLLNWFKDCKWNAIDNETLKREDIIAWLEKQDPKKREEELERAYKCADEVQYRKGYEDAKKELEKQDDEIMATNVLTKAGLKPYKDGNKWCILVGDNIQDGICGFGDTVDEALFEFLKELVEQQGKQIPAVKAEPKFHEGDKLVSTKNPRLTYEVLEIGNINELGNPEYKVEIFTDGKAKNPRNIHYIECYKVEEWAKLIEQNPAWSEEDETMIEDIIEAIDTQYAVSDYNEMVSWLKFLKERVGNFDAGWKVGFSAAKYNQWKPTDEQMKALLSKLPVIKGGGDKVQDILESLYEDLKKLREK